MRWLFLLLSLIWAWKIPAQNIDYGVSISGEVVGFSYEDRYRNGLRYPEWFVGGGGVYDTNWRLHHTFANEWQTIIYPESFYTFTNLRSGSLKIAGLAPEEVWAQNELQQIWEYQYGTAKAGAGYIDTLHFSGPFQSDTILVKMRILLQGLIYSPLTSPEGVSLYHTKLNFSTSVEGAVFVTGGVDYQRTLLPGEQGGLFDKTFVVSIITRPEGFKFRAKLDGITYNVGSFGARIVGINLEVPTGIEVHSASGVFLQDPPPLEVNQPPAVKAGGPYRAVYGQTVQLQGTADDPDVGFDDDLTATWDLNNDGMYDDAVDLNPVISLEGPQWTIGTREIHLKVFDTFGASTTASTTLTIEPAPLLGDLNREGSVDQADLNILLEQIRARASDLTYDLNGDGKVTIADARFLILHFTNP